MGDKLIGAIRLMFRLWHNNARMDLMWLLRDTRLCLICIAADFIVAMASVAGVFLLSERFGGLGGFTGDEMLLMLGYGLCVDGLRSALFGNQNTSAPSRRFGRGQVDHMTVQPVPIWMQLLTDGFLPITGSSMLVAGIAVAAVAIGRLHIAVTGTWLALLVIELLSSLGVVMGFLFLTAVPALYAQVAAEEISSTVNDFFYSMRQFPLGSLPAWLRGLLATALPAGLSAWLPTAALVGRTPLWSAFVSPLMAALFIVCAIFFVRKGLKHYAKVGASRYSARGFRN